MSQMDKLREMALQFSVVEEVEENEERKDYLKDTVRPIVNGFFMQMALFKKIIWRKLFLILLDQKELQRDIILQEAF
jgi:hypothetical protein